MYGITVKQKKALKNAVVQYCRKYDVYPENAEVLPEYDAIGDMNPCEVYWPYANRYIEDIRRDDPYLSKIGGRSRW